MRFFLVLMFVFAHYTSSLCQTFTQLTSTVSSSLRGISTVGNDIVWVSGNQGTVGFSKDKGLSWHWVNPADYKSYDFRAIKAFSEKEALIMSVGSPAVILRTVNSGKTWTEVLRDDRAEIFLDAMAFEGNVGYAVGDPIDGIFQLFQTKDKGKNWLDITNNMIMIADEGEAAFAASGSSIQLIKGVLYLGTGGRYSSFFAYNPKKLRVDKYDAPLWSEVNYAGIFAIDLLNNSTGIVVGGHYKNDTDNRNNILLTADGGVNWRKPTTPVLGFRSDVQYIDKDNVLATGTTGTDISADAGENWKNISDLSFNALAKSKNGKIVYLVGSEGKIYRLDL